MKDTRLTGRFSTKAKKSVYFRFKDSTVQRRAAGFCAWRMGNSLWNAVFSLHLFVQEKKKLLRVPRRRHGEPQGIFHFPKIQRRAARNKKRRHNIQIVFTLILFIMSIKYKSIQKGQPGVAGGGEKKFYASIAVDGEVTVDDLVKEIEKFSALSEPDIRGVIIALENVIQNKLADSKMVRLEKLGTFYPALHSEGRDTETEVGSHVIRSVGVNYRPGARILATMKEAGTKKTV
jgi:predicted histone-like DNA-binding protein